MDTLYLIQRIETIARLSKYRHAKIYKKRIDPFSIPNNQFKQKYRFNKQTVRKIVNLLKNDIAVERRGCGTSPELQVLVALCCWGQQKFQGYAGDIHGLAQPTVSRICAKVARSLVKHEKEYINMPESVEEEGEIAKQFKAIRNLSGIIGAIDATHVKIKKTGGDLAQYSINKNGIHSINVQVICDPQHRILDIVARWTGSTPDFHIFNESKIKEQFENNEFRGRLIGDLSYKQTPYLFTPLQRPQNEKEIKYNIAHIATRNPVEQCFREWKQRFRCLLDGMSVTFSNAKLVIVALAVLHNIAIEENDTVPDDCEYNSDEEMSDND